MYIMYIVHIDIHIHTHLYTDIHGHIRTYTYIHLSPIPEKRPSKNTGPAEIQKLAAATGIWQLYWHLAGSGRSLWRPQAEN